MDYNAVWMFVKVVQAGSFSGAARQLGVPKSTVSKRISELERELRMMLLMRTTRRLQLTTSGKEYFESCARAFSQLQDAQLQTHAVQGVRGTLRLAAPEGIGATFLTGMLSEFMEQYPEVDLDLVLGDEVLDLIASQVDVAVRAGDLEDSSLKSRRVGTSRFSLFASPRYLKARGVPTTPADLEEHRCLRYTTAFGSNVWELRSGARKTRVKISGRFTANNISALRAMTAHGHGIALLPTLVCHADLAEGRLVPVLEDWSTGDEPIHLVYPQQAFVSPRLRAFLEFLTPRLRKALVEIQTLG